MLGDIRIRIIGQHHRDLLLAMYDRFDPLGEALGLPPRVDEARRAWVQAALHHAVNLAAFSPAGEAAGHCFLVRGDADAAELAVFVHQEFRRTGVGTALVKAALQWAAALGLRRVWSLTPSGNIAAIRLQLRCGFRPANPIYAETTLEIDLRAA
jgi:RimJ/RimL family protein N-acetyltransferase